MTASAGLIVATEAGRIEGVESPMSGVRVFKGVPYARPPVGALRWRPPEPPLKWDGVRPAKAFGPRSIQFDRDKTSISYFGPEAQSEDCLTLNVWTAAREPDEKRPVMVWFHGGAFAVGSGALPIFNGERLAQRCAIVVTVNHRLGVLGFMAHPELSAESPHGSSGNYGLLDEIAALRWVRDNIAAFGGDPDCVTIFGQSVGSSSVNVLMATPLARGLFHRAIAESGGLMAPLGKPGGGSMYVREVGEKFGQRYAEFLGARSIADMRALPAERVQLGWPNELGRMPVTVLDGWLLPEEIFETYRAGRQARVPFICGATRNEGATLPAPADWSALRRWLDAEYGDLSRIVLDHYGERGDPSEHGRTIRGHITFNWQNWVQTCEHARSGEAPVYAYHFERAPPIPPATPCFENSANRLGAFHTSEIHYVFGTLDARPWNWTQADRDLSDAMGAYWVNFARTGNPNGAELPAWPAFDREHERVQIFGENVRTDAHPLRAELAMWDNCMAKMREASHTEPVA